MASGSWVDPAAGRVAFGEWAEEWLATVGLTWRARTAEKHRMAIDVHWRPRFGQLPVKAITTEAIQRAINELAATHSPATVRTYYGTLRSCLKFAADREVITRSPCRSIKLPSLDGEEKMVVSVTDLHRLAEAVGPRWRAFIYLAGVTGLRFGEIGALRLSDIDLEVGEISVTRTLIEVAGQGLLRPAQESGQHPHHRLPGASRHRAGDPRRASWNHPA